MIILYGLLTVVYLVGIALFTTVWADFDRSSTRQAVGGICLILWAIMFPAVVLQCIGVF